MSFPAKHTSAVFNKDTSTHTSAVFNEDTSTHTSAVFNKDTSTKTFTSKTLPQYTKYIKDQKNQNNLVQKFKFKFDCSSDFFLTRSQQIALDAIDSALSSESKSGKRINFGIFGKAGVGKSALINVIRKRFERKKLSVQI
jgi:ribosome biogenesis GTPase A